MSAVGRRLGRRGAILLTLGISYLLVGAATLLIPPPSGAPTHGVLYFALPDPVRAALWVVSGLVAVGFSWRRWDWPGYLALFVVPAIRCGTYFLAALLDGSLVAAYQGVLQLPVIAVALICAGWQEPHQQPPLTAPPLGFPQHPQEV